MTEERWPLTMDECAARLHVSRSTLYKLIKVHPYYRRAGRRILFTEGDFERLVDDLPRAEGYGTLVSKPASDAYESVLKQCKELQQKPRQRARRRPQQSVSAN